MEHLPRSPRSTIQTRQAGEAIAVRVSHGSAILCGRCGCLLARFDQESGPDRTWYHFIGTPGHDARGCSVDCLRLPHRLMAVASD
jgi:hypothetical protein